MSRRRLRPRCSRVASDLTGIRRFLDRTRRWYFRIEFAHKIALQCVRLAQSGCVPRDRGVSSTKLKDHRDIVACWFGRLNFDEAGFVSIVDSGKIYIGVVTRDDVLDQGQAATIGRYPTRNRFPTGPVGANRTSLICSQRQCGGTVDKLAAVRIFDERPATDISEQNVITVVCFVDGRQVSGERRS